MKREQALERGQGLDLQALGERVAGEALEVKPKAPAVPPREAGVREEERSPGLLPPPVADPRPTS